MKVVYCPYCGGRQIDRLNTAADGECFECGGCGERFEVQQL